MVAPTCFPPSLMGQPFITSIFTWKYRKSIQGRLAKLHIDPSPSVSLSDSKKTIWGFLQVGCGSSTRKSLVYIQPGKFTIQLALFVGSIGSKILHFIAAFFRFLIHTHMVKWKRWIGCCFHSPFPNLCGSVQKHLLLTCRPFVLWLLLVWTRTLCPIIWEGLKFIETTKNEWMNEWRKEQGIVWSVWFSLCHIPWPVSEGL